ncbi:MAG: hypothetical protein JW947_02165 [Sedimentisphaerales bacterium]|nr:hypothetical protein [Sedimentisphaerales bacterium]
MLRKNVNIVVILAVLCLSLAILANSMTKSIGRDEQRCCTAGVLLAQGKAIYRDFSYPSQMPYYPLFCAALFKVSNTTYFLLAARILACLCDVLVVVCIVSIYRRVFNSFPVSAMLLGLSAAFLYVFNPFVDDSNGFAWQHDLVVLFIMLSLWLFMSTDFKHKSRYYRVAAIAVLLTLATCMQVTALLVYLLFFAAFLIMPADTAKQKFQTVLPFLIVTALVVVWPLWTIISAPRAFFLNLSQISMLSGNDFHSKIGVILLFLATRGCFVLLLIAVYLCLAIVWKYRKLTMSKPAGLLLAALLACVFFVIALILLTAWEQYLATFVPFILITFAFPLLYLRKLDSDIVSNKFFKLARALIISCAIAAVASYPVVFYRVPKLFDLQNWSPLCLHRISKDIAAQTNHPKLMLTLAPLYALEGGCDIYPEFASGSLVYKFARHLSPSDRRITRTIGYEDLDALVGKFPPSALILFVEYPHFEAPLLQAAKPNQESWDVKVFENGPVVFFRR